MKFEDFNSKKMFTPIVKIIEGFSSEVTTITEERLKVLLPLANHIQNKRNLGEKVRLNFICTHNSRRSHLSQIWAQTMAFYFGFDNIECYSGGTEATALFPKVAETLTNQGFQVFKLSEGENPVYAVKYAKNEMPIICFSKTYDNEFNPKSQFAAVMTCSSADEGCPVVLGAELRLPIKYEDPKIFDGSDQQDQKYLEKSLEIAKEMFWVFQSIK